jgi:hypothetical protein
MPNLSSIQFVLCFVNIKRARFLKPEMIAKNATINIWQAKNKPELRKLFTAFVA